MLFLASECLNAASLLGFNISFIDMTAHFIMWYTLIAIDNRLLKTNSLSSRWP